jgi:hypothetical protein
MQRAPSQGREESTTITYVTCHRVPEGQHEHWACRLDRCPTLPSWPRGFESRHPLGQVRQVSGDGDRELASGKDLSSRSVSPHGWAMATHAEHAATRLCVAGLRQHAITRADAEPGQPGVLMHAWYPDHPWVRTCRASPCADPFPARWLAATLDWSARHAWPGPKVRPSYVSRGNRAAPGIARGGAAWPSPWPRSGGSAPG